MHKGNNEQQLTSTKCWSNHEDGNDGEGESGEHALNFRWLDSWVKSRLLLYHLNSGKRNFPMLLHYMEKILQCTIPWHVFRSYAVLTLRRKGSYMFLFLSWAKDTTHQQAGTNNVPRLPSGKVTYKHNTWRAYPLLVTEGWAKIVVAATLGFR